MGAHAAYVWSAYAAAGLILPVMALASLLRLRGALRRQAALEADLDAMRADGDG
ncbi:MAG: heme exporter protein CcmD [Alphaproteobacteria bacterium]|nr:heme exporter protein CcmD [Alphaproteobacteria bacterium]